MRNFLRFCVLAALAFSVWAEAVVSVTPSTGQGGEFDATVSVSDQNGIANIGEVRLLIKHDMNAANSCYIVHYPGTATVLLRNDSDTAWGRPLALGSSDSDTNSQCTVFAGPSAVTATGDVYSLTLHVHFAKQFAGVRRIWAESIDSRDPTAARWNMTGEWLVSADPSFPARIERFRPASSTPGVDVSLTPSTDFEPKVYRNGLLMSPSDDYTMTGKTVTFVRALMAGDLVQVEYSPVCKGR